MWNATDEKLELERYLYIARMWFQAELIWERERRFLELFGVKDGIKILEAGSGPGFITEKLARSYPNSTITVVEREPFFIEWSLRYWATKNIDTVKTVSADIKNTGITPESVDLIYARFLFQHLPDPRPVLDEFYRLLKPGGKVIITDIDEGYEPLLSPKLPEIEPLFANQGNSGGRDTAIGRKLWRLLRGSGFHSLDLEALLIHSDAVGTENMFLKFDIFAAGRRVEHGMMSVTDLEKLQQLRQRFLGQPEAYFSYLLFMGYGEK